MLEQKEKQVVAAQRSSWVLLLFLLMTALVIWLLAQESTFQAGSKTKGISNRPAGGESHYPGPAQELIARHDYVHEQVSSLVGLYTANCTSAEQEIIQAGVRQGGARWRQHEGLCYIYADAMDMLTSYAGRWDEGQASPPFLFRFSLLVAEGEKAIGPFLSRSDCSLVAARLAKHGEHVTSCVPYEEWRHELFLASGKAS